MTELNHKFNGYRRGDFVSVLFERSEETGEVSDWWRPALYLGHDKISHHVIYVTGDTQALNPQTSIRSEMSKKCC